MREELLAKYHPQWDLTNEELKTKNGLFGRDGFPICIPPSCDLSLHYFENKKELLLFAGDRSKAEFLNVLRNSLIGGILIGDVNCKDLLHANLATNDEDAIVGPIILRQFLKKEKEFQIDFLHFHESGIVHFEVKAIKNEEEKTPKRNQQDILMDLFKYFCNVIGINYYLPADQNGNDFRDNLWHCIFRQTVIVYMNHIEERNDTLSSPLSSNSTTQEIFGKEMLKKWLGERDLPLSRNCFKDEIYRSFLVFLAAYRPDYFISPVKCSLVAKKNIFSRFVNINNYYRGDRDTSHHIAKTVAQFLKELKFVENVAIELIEPYKNVYLTTQQQVAVGRFNRVGSFFPKRQLIVGPPGSGKSLILMLKMFIAGQLREEKELCYWSRSIKHRDRMSDFVARNQSKFYKEMHTLTFDNQETITSEGCDVILDDQECEYLALRCLSSRHADQMVVFVWKGLQDNVTMKKDIDESIIENLDSCNFVVTELQTVFRSTRQIQSYIRSRCENVTIISGHNFDGIKVEEYICDDEEQLKRSLHERIQRLIEIECCDRSEIGLYQPKRYVDTEAVENSFIGSYGLTSLEFSVMIVVKPYDWDLFVSLSRAACHLIVFTADNSFGAHTLASSISTVN